MMKLLKGSPVMKRSTAIRATLTAMLTIVLSIGLFLPAFAQTSDECYPIASAQCEEPEVQPTVIENDDTPNGAVDSGDELAATGVDSAVWILIAVALVGGGALAVVAGGKRESTDA